MMRVGRKILIVDDDGALRQSLAEQLELHEEFTSVQCDSAARALQLGSAERFDAILLDVGLPDMDGRELCRLLRRAGVLVPIVMLTGADSEADTILGLEAGADDYVTKPFRLSVLLARLRAHLRQSEYSDDAVLTIGPYTFRPGAKLLTDTVLSIRAQCRGTAIGILDFGLASEQREWLAGRVTHLVRPGWDVDFPDRERTPETRKAQLSRPFLRRHFPGYETYLWIDADAWVQDWRAVELYLAAAGRDKLAVTPEIDRAYKRHYKRPKIFGWTLSW